MNYGPWSATISGTTSGTAAGNYGPWSNYVSGTTTALVIEEGLAPRGIRIWKEPSHVARKL